MPSVQCAVVGCHNGTYKLERWKKEMCNIHRVNKGCGSCICDPPFILFPFPTQTKNSHARNLWIRQVNRKDKIHGKIWLPKPYDRICSDHFKDKQPSEKHPYPTENMGYTTCRSVIGRIKTITVSPKKKTKNVAKVIAHTHPAEESQVPLPGTSTSGPVEAICHSSTISEIPDIEVPDTAEEPLELR